MKIGVTSNVLWSFPFQAAVREETRHFEDVLFSILIIKRNSVLLQRQGIHFFCLSISFIFFKTARRGEPAIKGYVGLMALGIAFSRLC